MRIALLLALFLAPPVLAGAAEPLHANRTTVLFGHKVVLSGRFSHGYANEPVSIESKEYGEASYLPISVVMTTAGGRWSVSVVPSIETTYQALSMTDRTVPVEVRVRPQVTLAQSGRRFVIRVTSTASYERRFVFVQRRGSRRWKNVARVVLRRQPRRFNVRLPHGRSRLRVFLPRSQAGAGYLAGVSSTVIVRR